MRLWTMLKTKKRHNKTKYQLLPPLDPETYAGLRANIALLAAPPGSETLSS